MCEKLTQQFWRLPLTFDTTLQHQWSAKPMSSSASVSVSALDNVARWRCRWRCHRLLLLLDELSIFLCPVCLHAIAIKELHKEATTHIHTQTLARCIVISGRAAGTLSGNSCLCSCLPWKLGEGGSRERVAVGLEKMCKGILQFSLDIFSAKWPKGTFFLAVSFYHYYFYSAVAAQCCQLSLFPAKSSCFKSYLAGL